MITAISLSGDQIAETLGTTETFLILSDSGTERMPCTGKIPLLLKKKGVTCLVCNGIGNCMVDLLHTMKIKIIPGVNGTIAEIIQKLKSGSLSPGVNYSCTDHEKSCGICPGNF